MNKYLSCLLHWNIINFVQTQNLNLVQISWPKELLRGLNRSTALSESAKGACLDKPIYPKIPNMLI